MTEDITSASTQSNGCPTFSDLVRPDLKDYCRAANMKFNEQVRALMKEGRKVYHFGFGQAPFPVMEHMADTLKEHTTEAAYLPVAGLRELREAICQFHARYDRLDGLDPDNVLVGPGSKELIYLMMMVFHGDIMVMSPSWTTYKPQSRLAHHQAVTIETSMETEWRLTPDAVEEAVLANNLTGNKLLIFCNPDNPTGTSYTPAQLKSLSKTFRKHKIIVVSDEIYGRLHYTHQHACLSLYYPEGTVLSTGLSKWASAGGWRIGYHIYPSSLKQLKDAVHSAASHTYSTCSAPIQFTVAKALREEELCQNYMMHTTRIMKAVAEFCHSQLTAIGVKAVPPAGGFYMFPDFEVIRKGLRKRGITTGEQMCDAMFKECGVALMSGGPAFLRPDAELTTRMCFVNFDGAAALAASRQIGLDGALPGDFVQTHCTAVYDGVMALKHWVEKQKA